MKDESLLLRQVHPSWIRENRVTSQVFTPTPKDEGRISVYDGEQISAQASWHHFKKVLGNPSTGVLAVQVRECQNCKIPVTLDPKAFMEHVLLDFAGFSGNHTKKLAKKLTQFANSRGWQYRP